MKFSRVALLVLLVVGCASAQTAIYLRSGGPQAQVITGATNATPIVITTQSAHGFSSSCTTSAPCYCAVAGVPTGSGPSPANGVRECVYQSSTTLALYDTSGNPIAGSGNWWPGQTVYPSQNTAAQWVAPLTAYTIPANPGPLGYLDGSNGDLMRRVSTGPYTGLASTGGIVLTGCPSACVITESVTYDPLTMKFPVAAGQHFSITGSGTALDTCGDGTKPAGAQSPYTIASVTSSSWTSNPFTCAGLSNGDYTNSNLHCGPAATPNWTIGGNQACIRSSFLATTANPAWDYVVSKRMASGYKNFYDGGNLYGPGNQLIYALAAFSFLVDPTDATWLTEMEYAINYDFRTGGTGYHGNTAFWGLHQNEVYGEYDDADPEGLAIIYSVAFHAPEGAYGAASDQASFLNRTYNDLDDPSRAACTTTNQDLGIQGNHNWVLSSGLLAAGTNDSTHAQLPASDPCYSGTCYGGTGYVGAAIVLPDNPFGINFDGATIGNRAFEFRCFDS